MSNQITLGVGIELFVPNFLLSGDMYSVYSDLLSQKSFVIQVMFK